MLYSVFTPGARLCALVAAVAFSGFAILFADPDPAPAPPSSLERILGTNTSGSFLGVAVSEIDSARAKALNLKEEYGVEITRVEDGSPAAKGGLKVSDVLLEYNKQRIEGIEQFMRLVRETPAGREVTLQISRNGSPQTITLKTEARKNWIAHLDPKLVMPEVVIPDMQLQMPDIPRPLMGWRSPMLGIEAESVQGQLAAFFGVKEGVLVRTVLKGSAAERAGLKAGDVITRVDSTPVGNPHDIGNALRNSRGKKSVLLCLARERKEMCLRVSLDDDMDNSQVMPAPKANTVRGTAKD